MRQFLSLLLAAAATLMGLITQAAAEGSLNAGNAADGVSRGGSARPQPGRASTYTDYDHAMRLVASRWHPDCELGPAIEALPGHPSFSSGRSTLTANPEALIQRAGMGTPVGSVPRGQAGFKERIDFGGIIGTFISRDGASSPTSIAVLHYRADGSVPIIPGRPQ